MLIANVILDNVRTCNTAIQ